jgi:hypothetical protein
MKETSVAVTVEGNESARAAGHTGRGTSAPASLQALEKELFDRLEQRLEEVRKATAEGVVRHLQDRLASLVDERIKKQLSGSVNSANDRMRDAVQKVLQSVLFDSGILQKLVERSVDEKVGAAKGSPAGDLSDAAKKSIHEMMQKEIASAFSGETLKTMMDDKFRAISIYLKTEVVPKSIAQALKGRPPGA